MAFASVKQQIAAAMTTACHPGCRGTRSIFIVVPYPQPSASARDAIRRDRVGPDEDGKKDKDR